MTAITGFGVLPSFLSRSSSQAPAANEIVAQSLDAAGATGADNATTAQTGATTPVPIGSSAAPKLSTDVIGALIESQAQQTAGSTSGSGATGQTTLAGATAISGPAAASANSSSGPLTLQQIAGQFDLQSMTYQQDQQLEGDLVSSGAITQQDGQHFMALNTMDDIFNSQHFTLSNGQAVATTPSSGTVNLDTLDLPPTNEVQLFQDQVAEDPSLGDSTQTAEDQNILNVLNQLQSLQSGGTA
jgi:hypothetical protein